MPIISLKEVLETANKNDSAVAGLVVLGWEDAHAYVEAAEALRCPVILQAGPGCRAHTPMNVLAPMLRYLAEQANVPVVVHMDHGYEVEECYQAIDLGFSSVMFDGSRKTISENIDLTASIVERARQAGVSVEGEVGFVGYADGAASAGTNADEAARFARESGADAMAISIGNVHLQQEKAAVINFERLRAIELVTNIPLVLHGGSGIPLSTRRQLALTTNVAKFNIGTEVRMAFGEGICTALAENPAVFDRISILKTAERSVYKAACRVIQNLSNLSPVN